jgi:hypothetical protein
VVGALVDVDGAFQSNDSGLVQRSKGKLPKDWIAFFRRAGSGPIGAAEVGGAPRTSRVGNGKKARLCSRTGALLKYRSVVSGSAWHSKTRAGVSHLARSRDS